MILTVKLELEATKKWAYPVCGGSKMQSLGQALIEAGELLQSGQVPPFPEGVVSGFALQKNETPHGIVYVNPDSPKLNFNLTDVDCEQSDCKHPKTMDFGVSMQQCVSCGQILTEGEDDSTAY